MLWNRFGLGSAGNVAKPHAIDKGNCLACIHPATTGHKTMPELAASGWKWYVKEVLNLSSDLILDQGLSNARTYH
jgi:hypothetical protein